MPYPSKFTPEVRERIVRLIAAGNPAVVAAEAAGVAERTFYAWLERGQQTGKAARPYREFRAAVQAARAEGEAILVTRIAKAATNGSWGAAAWLLERRWPERWAKIVDRSPSGKQDSAPAQQEDPFAKLDELASRRQHRV